MKADFYEILQVSPNAEPEVIESAYRRLARKYHPDVNPSPDAEARMKEINEAYEILSDPQKRAMYDAQRGFVRTTRYQYPPSPRAARPSYQPPKEPQPSPPPRRMALLARPLGAILAVLVLISCVASFLILPGRGFPPFGPTSYPTSAPYPTDTARPAIVLTPTPIGSSMPPTPTETPTPTSASVSTALPSPSRGQKSHIVEAGETLATIAAQFDTTVEALIAANGLTSPYVIYVGQELMIPGGGVVLPSPTKRAPAPSPTALPTPTYTPIPMGSSANPVPAGQSYTMANGWRVTVLSFDSDAWPEVQAENQFNDPSLPGQHMVMIRLRVEYVGEEYEPYSMFDAIFRLSGSSGREYTTFGDLSRCGVIPDPLYAKGYRGSIDEGNICFQIPNEESNLIIVCDVITGQYRTLGRAYFAVQ